MYGLMGSFKAAEGRRAELNELMLAETGAALLIAAFGERRDTRPVGEHAL